MSNPVLQTQRTGPEVELNGLRVPLVYRAHVLAQGMPGVREPAALPHHLDQGPAYRQLGLTAHYVRVAIF